MAEREVQRLAKILGNSIVERRKILGMTQIELANRLDMAPDALSRIENGYVAPRFNRIEEMAKVLECSVAELFRSQGAEIYCAELVAPQSVRLERNRTENRLRHKASKRDLNFSEERLRHEDSKYRLVSNPGEIPFENYIRIDTSELSADETAERIISAFSIPQTCQTGKE